MLASVAVQASLSQTWSETPAPEDRFSHYEAQIYKTWFSCVCAWAAVVVMQHCSQSDFPIDLSAKNVYSE